MAAISVCVCIPAVLRLKKNNRDLMRVNERRLNSFSTATLSIKFACNFGSVRNFFDASFVHTSRDVS